MAWGMPPLPRRISKPRLSEITFLALKIAKDLAHRKNSQWKEGSTAHPAHPLTSPMLSFAFETRGEQVLSSQNAGWVYQVQTTN